MNKTQDKGFTLVELLIVIVILGILASVTVFAVRGITDRGQENACSIEKRTIETAAEAFYAQQATNTYPADIASMDLKDTAGATARWTYTPVAGPPASFTLVATAGGKCA